ncbi:MAG: hypothetical protein AMQ74_01740 [Candidatus Methanofastidiosum methylothiophilum]|uniref:Uncharacterized protein n=1 Tax=Candidatus Methanofastidiosum methylothiophilum TaxID=1705564 RepID=A0A150IPG9_9EURY|nr:MAG: hypothetical protein AMQ74_01740 [Candidatus Methanofastidiosum methylthiophilus]
MIEIYPRLFLKMLYDRAKQISVADIFVTSCLKFMALQANIEKNLCKDNIVAHNYVYSHIIMSSDYESRTQIFATNGLHI